jgi:hypothetical protein
MENRPVSIGSKKELRQAIKDCKTVMVDVRFSDLELSAAISKKEAMRLADELPELTEVYNKDRYGMIFSNGVLWIC